MKNTRSPLVLPPFSPGARAIFLRWAPRWDDDINSARR
jgi:hypothetical protein